MELVKTGAKSSRTSVSSGIHLELSPPYAPQFNGAADVLFKNIGLEPESYYLTLTFLKNFGLRQ